MENTKQYIAGAVVSTVEHLVSISAHLETSLLQTISIPQTNCQIELLKTVTSNTLNHYTIHFIFLHNLII